MFNLFRSNAKITKYLLGGLLLIVAASMVTYLIPSTGLTDNTIAPSGVVAEVGGDTITVDDAKAAVDRMLASNQVPKEAIEVYVPQIVDQMIQDRAANYTFSKLGLTVSDEEILIGFNTIYPQLFKDGKLVSTDQLAQNLDSQQHISLAEGVESMRRSLLLKKVQNMAYATVIITPQDIDRALTQRHQSAKIEYIAFPQAKFRGDVKITPEDMQKAYDANAAAYLLPEQRSFQVLVADQQKIEESIKVTDAQLRAAYASSMDSFRFPERVKVRHILLMTQGKSDAEKKAALSKAQELLKQVKGGADFADLAKKNSQDPGSAQNGGDLGFIVRGQTVPEFEKFAFSGKPKDISDIVTTEYGYHIIQVLEKEPARVKPFDEVKGDIETQLKKQGVNEKTQAAADQARAALLKAPGSAAEVAKQFNLDLISVSKADVGQPVPSLGPAPEISVALGSMKPNDVSEVLTLSATKLAVVVLNDKIAPRPAAFADVKERIREQLLTAASTTLAAQAAQKAAEQIKAGADMDKVAKSFKLEVTKSANFTTSESIEGLGPAASLPGVFTQPVGTVNGPLTVQARNIVYKIVDQQKPDLKTFANERDAVSAELKQQKARTMYDLFQDSIMNELREQGKLKIHQDTLRQLAASYHVNPTR
jgi:peptidyl-prolyl cis-trans isomerase D